MEQVTKLVGDLSRKFDSLREDVDSLKKRNGKHKKKKNKRSRRYHSHPRTQSRSRSRSPRRANSPQEGRESRRDSPSRSGSASPRARRRPRGHRDDRGSSPSNATSPSRHSRSGERTQGGSGDMPEGNRASRRTPRDWEDIPDVPNFEEPLHWDSDEGERPATRLLTVSEETESLLKEACTKRLLNSARLQTRNTFQLPQVAATRTPQLDSFIKPEISQPIKTADKELGKLQTFVLDALAPLTSLLEIDARGENITHNQALDASKAAIKLLGNASAQISHVRRTKVVTHLNKSLLPLLEEDSNFGEVAPSLFGPEFARKSKELVDQVKAIRSHSLTQKDGRTPFFRQIPPKSRGGYSQRQGRGGGQSYSRGGRQFQQGRKGQWTK